MLYKVFDSTYCTAKTQIWKKCIYDFKRGEFKTFLGLTKLSTQIVIDVSSVNCYFDRTWKIFFSSSQSQGFLIEKAYSNE